jgi:hypothetical protein
MILRSFLFIFGLVAANVDLTTGRAEAHGTPIHVSVNESINALVVDAPFGAPVELQGDYGFAPWLFAEENETGEFDPDSVPHPVLGPVLLWYTPGFAITEMHGASSLSMEVLVRPVIDEDAAARGALWYWNPMSETVEPAPAGSPLNLLTASGSLAIPRDQSTPLPQLDNSPAAAPGVYGFFARLTSNLYGPSNPFLVALNYGAPSDEVFAAAHAINRHAFLAGDYNHDDVVDMHDYPVWKSLYGHELKEHELADGNGNGAVDAADYTVWRNNSGASVIGGTALAGLFKVPEPTSLLIAAAGWVFVIHGSRSRHKLS